MQWHSTLLLFILLGAVHAKGHPPSNKARRLPDDVCKDIKFRQESLRPYTGLFQNDRDEVHDPKIDVVVVWQDASSVTKMKAAIFNLSPVSPVHCACVDTSKAIVQGYLCSVTTVPLSYIHKNFPNRTHLSDNSYVTPRLPIVYHMLNDNKPVEPAPISWWNLIEKHPTSNTVVLSGEEDIGDVDVTLKGEASIPDMKESYLPLDRLRFRWAMSLAPDRQLELRHVQCMIPGKTVGSAEPWDAWGSATVSAADRQVIRANDIVETMDVYLPNIRRPGEFVCTLYGGSVRKEDRRSGAFSVFSEAVSHAIADLRRSGTRSYPVAFKAVMKLVLECDPQIGCYVDTTAHPTPSPSSPTPESPPPSWAAFYAMAAVVGSLLLLAAAYAVYRQTEQAPAASDQPGAAVELFSAAKTPDVENAAGPH